jgi:hypothetical protein
MLILFFAILGLERNEIFVKRQKMSLLMRTAVLLKKKSNFKRPE